MRSAPVLQHACYYCKKLRLGQKCGLLCVRIERQQWGMSAGGENRRFVQSRGEGSEYFQQRAHFGKKNASSYWSDSFKPCSCQCLCSAVRGTVRFHFYFCKIWWISIYESLSINRPSLHSAYDEAERDRLCCCCCSESWITCAVQGTAAAPCRGNWEHWDWMCGAVFQGSRIWAEHVMWGYINGSL